MNLRFTVHTSFAFLVNVELAPATSLLKRKVRRPEHVITRDARFCKSDIRPIYQNPPKKIDNSQHILFCFPSNTMISSSEQKYIVEGCRENCRQDGRSRQEFQSYSTISGGSHKADGMEDQPTLVLSNGSARTFLATGETHVLTSVKAELVVPAISHPNSGVIDIHVDFMHNKDESLEATISSLLLPHLVDT